MAVVGQHDADHRRSPLGEVDGDPDLLGHHLLGVLPLDPVMEGLPLLDLLIEGATDRRPRSAHAPLRSTARVRPVQVTAVTDSQGCDAAAVTQVRATGTCQSPPGRAPYWPISTAKTPTRYSP
jgi:hypothetical protein